MKLYNNKKEKEIPKKRCIKVKLQKITTTLQKLKSEQVIMLLLEKKKKRKRLSFLI